MAKHTESEFIKVNIDIIRKIDGKLPFDVYIQRTASSFTKIFPSGEVVDLARVDQYKKKNLQDFSVKEEDYKQYLIFVETLATEAFDPKRKLGTNEIVSILGELTDATMVDIMVNTSVDENSIRAASKTVQGCIKVLSNDPNKFAEIFKLLARHPYGIKHSISTTFFALLLGTRVQMESEKSTQIIGLGALLHDVGMAMLDIEEEDAPDLTPDQFKDVKEHPQIGKKVLENIPNIPPEVRMIVLQHHEQPNGMGYPNRMHGPEIYPLAKLISVADGFAALVSKRTFREALSPSKAYELMQEDIGKYDKHLMAELAKLFIRVDLDR